MPVVGGFIKCLRESVAHSRGQKEFTHEELSKDITRITGTYVHSADLRELERGSESAGETPVRILDVIYNYANETGFSDLIWQFYRRPWEKGALAYQGWGDARDYKYDEKGQLVHRQPQPGEKVKSQDKAEWSTRE